MSDDIYPKCAATLKGLRGYESLALPLLQQPLPKSKRVFDTSKVTDHHAIIPTGVPANNLTDMERHVYDLVARRFISVFYPDCKFSTTTVLAETGGVEFKATGKVIVDPGWRVVYAKEVQPVDDNAQKNEQEERTLPPFEKGESGPHAPTLTEKLTTPPKYYTEATLLRAMETAGKFVDDEALRAALKENGIGRPSSRANIIETLFKRKYIRRERKNIVATPTGIDLIDVIKEDLLKSCELTGIWEKKLRDIEHRQYDAALFIDELKAQITQIVKDVLADSSNRRLTLLGDDDLKAKHKKKKTAKTSAKSQTQEKTTATSAAKSASPIPIKGQASTQPLGETPAPVADAVVGSPCPKCHQGHLIKGKTAYGCSRWREGCDYRQPFGN